MGKVETGHLNKFGGNLTNVQFSILIRGELVTELLLGWELRIEHWSDSVPIRSRSISDITVTIAARRLGEEYFFERKLVRRKSTGEVVNPAWLQFSYPTRWHYDVLRALDYFRSVGDVADSRIVLYLNGLAYLMAHL